jgi:hypothetical protein
MKISKTHQALANNLKNPKVLTNPEDFLGPNWEDVINFWFYVDTLSESEISKIGDRYLALDYHVRDAARLAARVSAEEVVGWKVRSAAWCATRGVVVASATIELLGHQRLLEQGKPLTFLPLCIKKKNRLQILLSSIKQLLNL